jgi:hypothetical protein
MKTLEHTSSIPSLEKSTPEEYALVILGGGTGSTPALRDTILAHRTLVGALSPFLIHPFIAKILEIRACCPRSPEHPLAADQLRGSTCSPRRNSRYALHCSDHR